MTGARSVGQCRLQQFQVGEAVIDDLLAAFQLFGDAVLLIKPDLTIQAEREGVLVRGSVETPDVRLRIFARIRWDVHRNDYRRPRKTRTEWGEKVEGAKPKPLRQRTRSRGTLLSRG